MRNVDFNVSSQRIYLVSKDPLVSGTKGFLQAVFNFSKEWNGFDKTAFFYDSNNKEYEVSLTNNKCAIPDEVLGGGLFKVKVIGKKGDMILPTTRVVVRQVSH